MKTLEEKAKAYDRTLEIAKAWHKLDNNDLSNDDLETLFPELAESKDEKIRKEIIKFLELPHPQFVGKRHQEDWIAWLEKQESVDEIVGRCKNSWYNEGKIAGQFEGLTNDEKYQQGWHDALEKQGEQNLIKIPKFKSGDTIEFNGFGYNRYTIKDVCGTSHYINTNNARMDMSYTDANFELVEQKPADKVEPKFKVGDWVVRKDGKSFSNGNHYAQITVIDKEQYWFDSGTWLETKDIRLWTIQDAEDGDVLCDYHEAYDNPLIFILKKFEHVNFGLVRPSDYSSYCFLTAGDIQRFKEGTYHHKHNIKPATKEQRNLLFQKMKEAGYVWNADQKKLEKIKKTPQKFMVGDTIRYNGTEYKITEITPNGYKVYALTYDEDAVSLISFSAPVILVEQKSAWSEEDENRFNRICGALKRYEMSLGASTNDIDWLKQLKTRYTWKPSDEQIRPLEYAIDYFKKKNNDTVYLESLYNDLKKLKGE